MPDNPFDYSKALTDNQSSFTNVSDNRGPWGIFDRVPPGPPSPLQQTFGELGYTFQNNIIGDNWLPPLKNVDTRNKSFFDVPLNAPDPREWLRQNRYSLHHIFVDHERHNVETYHGPHGEIRLNVDKQSERPFSFGHYHDNRLW